MNFSRLSTILSKVSYALGKGISWVSLLLVITVFSTVVMRYVFKQPSIMLQEMGMWFHSLIFMLGIAYTLAEDEHVRVDIFYRRFSEKNQIWVNLWGTLLLLLPLCFYLFSESWRYVGLSWRVKEASSEVGGLPDLYILKSLLLIMPVLLALQGIANSLQGLHQLIHPHKNNEDQHHLNQQGNI